MNIRQYINERSLPQIQADHSLSSDELSSALQKILNPPTSTSALTPGSISQYAYIDKVYPMEDYFVYTQGEKKYRQKYTLDDDGEVSFDGDPTEVKLKYVDASVLPMERAMGLSSLRLGGPGSGRRPGGGRQFPEVGRREFKQRRAHPVNRPPYLGQERRASGERRLKKNFGGIKRGFDRGYQQDSYSSGVRAEMGLQTPAAVMRFMKCGKAIRLKELLPQYMKAVKGGWQCKACGSSMKAKAAPGWEDTVKKMKGHPDINNPYALTNWMSEQGYQPGGSKKKD